jgi:signal transduction histidine kinase
MLRGPADMSFEEESPAHQQIAREEQARVFGSVASGRVLGIPLFAALLLALAWFEPIAWRKFTLLGMAIVLPTFFLVELRRYKKVGFEQHTIARNLILSAMAQLVVSAATGGILSPVIYGVVPLSGVSATLMDRRRRLMVNAGQIVVVFTFATLAFLGVTGFASPVSWAAPVALPATFYFLHASVLSLVTLAVGGISNLLSGAFSQTFRRATHTQEELLQSHATRVKELTTLSAEIAHELKNPLASIKGLSALLVQNISDDRGSERLRVLRREIDRMQTVLEEFLNFSRPLVPLSLAQCDLRALVGEVLVLHEGLARQKNVRLVLDGPAAEARCDPNKVKQVLINLVQNALDASPEGDELQVSVASGADDVVVAVEDEGPGIDGELADVFQPGITSKSGGSGIGLTIARALARQHGGELTLARRDGKGIRAELRLPRQPAAVLAQEVA